MLLLLLTLAAIPAGAEDGEDRSGTDATDQEESLPVEVDDAGVPQTSRGIDEMVVLATGRDDFRKDMSVSMTSFSGADIKSMRIQNIADLADFTPNLEINTRSSASNPTLFIRGIGLKDYNANAASAVAVYQDGINLNSPAIQLGQLFDTEEIAVLRGPQGSVNGRNATAGAIMISSVLPDGDFDTSGSATYGNYNAVELEGAIAFPWVQDLLSSRTSFTANFRDGTTRNHCANWDPESVGKPLLNEETIKLAWEWNGSPTNRNRFPNSNDNPNRRERDSQGRPLFPDQVCIWSDPGHLEFNLGEAFWVPSNDQTVLTPLDFQGLKPTVNNVKNWAARTIVRYQPDVSDGMDWILNLHGGQNLGDSTRLQALRTEFVLNEGNPYFTEGGLDGGEVRAALNSGLEGIRVVPGLSPIGTSADNIVPGGRGGADVDAGFYSLDGLELLDAWGLSLRGLWDTGPVSLSLLSGYEWYERSIDDEGDAIPIDQFPSFYDDSAWQASVEGRVDGEGERYRWSVGGFFLYEDLGANNIFPGIISRRIEQTFSQKLTSGAVYGNGRYWLLDEVYFDGGIRYNQESKKFTLASTILSLQGGSFEAYPEETVDKTWSGVTGEATLGWESGGDWMYDARLDSLNVYVKYGRGMKGGHFNAGLTIQGSATRKQRITAVDPEFIDALEGGFKSSWLQNRLSVNGAVFRYWYQDLQVFDFVNENSEVPIQQLLNSNANVLGAELEILARPLPGLLIQLGAGWLDSEFLDFFVDKAVNAPRGQGSGTVQFDYSGHPLIAAPEWNVSGVVDYQIPLPGGGSLVPQYNFSYRSKVYLDPQRVEVISQDPYWLHNLRLAYRTPDGRFEVALWVENLLNQRYKIDTFDLSIGENTILEVWNEPRMYGLTVSAYF